MKPILLTGGTGYIGSHIAAELLKRGREVVLADDLSNSRANVVDRLEALAGRRPVFYRVDVTDAAALEPVFAAHAISAVIHCAGYKAVGESAAEPLKYYGTIWTPR